MLINELHEHTPNQSFGIHQHTQIHPCIHLSINFHWGSSLSRPRPPSPQPPPTAPLENLKTFPGQLRDIVSPACPGSALGPPPGWTCLEHLEREVVMGHPHQMPNPFQLATLDVEEQRLYSESLPNDRASEGESRDSPECHVFCPTKQ